MALLSEQIEFLLTANPAQAIAGFESVARASDKAGTAVAQKWSSANSLIGFGAKALAVAGVATLGLNSMAQAASNLAESMNFAQREFGSSTGIVDRWAKQAATSAGLSERAALQATAGFAALGKAAGVSGDDLAQFSVNMAQLAADLASLRNTSLDEATAALTSALRGRYVAISKYGIIINDAILKQEAFNEGTYTGTGRLDAQARILATYNLLLAQSGAAQGDFVRTSGNLANQQRILGAQFENLKAGLGEGLLPIFKTVIGALNSGVGAFNNLSASTKSTIGTIMGIATIATAVVGGISLIAGAVMKMKDNFTNASGGLNAFGKAAAGVSIAMAGIGAISGTFAVINQINDIAGRTASNLQKLALASKGSSKDMVDSFAALVKTKDEGFSWSHLWTDFGDTIKIVGQKSSRSVADIQDAFNELFKQSPKEAQDLVNSIKEQADALDHNSAQYKDNMKLVTKWQETIDQSAAANKVLAGETEDATAALQVQEDTTKQVNKTLGELVDTLRDTDVAQEAAASGADAFAKAWEAVPFDDYLNGALDLRDANDTFFESLKKAEPVLHANQIIHGKLTEDQVNSTKALTDLSGKMQDYVGTLIKGGYTAEQTSATMENMRLDFDKQAKAAGLSDEKIKVLNETLGLTPEQVVTYLKIAGDEESKRKIELYTKLLGDIDPEVGSKIVTELAQGEYDAAVHDLEKLAADRTANVNVQLNFPKTGAEARAWLGSTGQGGGYSKSAGVSNFVINVPPTLNPTRVVSAVRNGQSRAGSLARG